MGASAAVALNPATPASAVEHVLDLVDLVLVMTVNPGFGGQAYIATMEPKIREVREMIDRRGLSDRIELEVDGGIAPGHGRRCGPRRRQHADRRERPVPRSRGSEHAVAELRRLAEQARRRRGPDTPPPYDRRR